MLGIWVASSKSASNNRADRGPTPCNEGESHDRNEHLDSAGKIGLPGSQQALVEAIAAAQPNYVVVLINGGALGVDWIAKNSPAVVEAFYPGEMGGDAIVDVLSGDYNPTGKLPVTVYPAAFAATRPITDMSLTSVDGITHLHYTGTPLWKFGAGESYTKFSVSQVDDTPDSATYSPDDFAPSPNFLTAKTLSISGAGSYELEVTNTGTVAGGFKLLGFVTCDDASVGFPVQRLFGFAGLESLAPGESRTVSLPRPTARQLSVADARGHSYLHPASYTVRIPVGLSWLFRTP